MQLTHAEKKAARRARRKAAGVVGGVVPPTGPNALFNVPGVGARSRRLKEGEERTFVRSDDGQFAEKPGAGADKPKPKKPAAKKPKQTPAERAAAQEAERAANVDKTFDASGLNEDAFYSLVDFAGGKADSLDGEKELIDAGLVEMGRDGKPRLTSAGRSLAGAAERGDTRAVADTMSRARDTQAARGERAQATAARQAERDKKRAEREAAREAKRAAADKKPKGGGGGKAPEAAPAATPQQLAARQEALDRIRRAVTGKAIGDPLRVVEHGGYTIEGNPTVRHAYQHAKQHDEVSAGWLEMMLKRGWAERRPDGSHVLRSVSPEPQAWKAMRPGRLKLWRSAYSEAKAAGHDRRGRLDAAKAALRKDTAERMRRQYERATLAVFKDATGVDRWLAVTTTAYEDQDQEWIARKAIRAVVERGDATGKRGVLRYWHVPGCDFGVCDYQATAQDDRFLIESGTFYSPRHAAVVKEAARRGYQMSPGFTHSPAEPGPARVYTDIDPFERSFVPRGRASNPFTRLAALGVPMLTPEKRKELIDLGVPAAMVDQFNAAVAATDKEAQRVSTFKSTDAPTAPTVYTGPDGAPGIIVGGAWVALKAVAEKAPMPPEQMMQAAMTEAADAGAELVEGDAPTALSDDDDAMDLTVGDLKRLVADAVLLAMGGSPADFASKMAEMKAQYEAMGKAFGSMQQAAKSKDDAAAAQAAELVALKESRDALANQLTALDARLKELEGDQPALKAYRASTDPATVVTPPAETVKAAGSDNPVVGAYTMIFGEQPAFPIG